MSNQDFRDQEPVWVTYLTYADNKSDKFYECRVDLGDDGLYYVTKRWGRRPDLGGGQIKVESSQNMHYCMNVANEMVRAKVRKGYHFTTRPERADSRVAKDYADEDY